MYNDMNLRSKFSEYGYVLLSGNELPTEATNTFAPGWHERYFAESFHQIDPVFDFARKNFRCSAATVLSPPDMASELFEEAKLFNADSNCIGVSQIGGSVMVLGAVNHDLDARSAAEVKSLCQVTHRRELIARLKLLSDTQIDVLDVAEEGYLDKEMAALFGITLSAFAQRKQNICRRLGFSSFRAAVSIYSLSKWGGIVPSTLQ